MELDCKTDNTILAAIQTNKEHYDIMNFMIDLSVEQLKLNIGEKKFPVGDPPIDFYCGVMKRYPIEKLMQSETLQKHLKQGSITFEIRLGFENMQSIVQKCKLEQRNAQIIFEMTQFTVLCDLKQVSNQLRFNKIISKFFDKTYKIPTINSTVTSLRSIIDPEDNPIPESKHVYYTYSHKNMDRISKGIQQMNLKFYNWLLDAIEKYIIKRKNDKYKLQQKYKVMLPRNNPLLRSQIMGWENLPTMSMNLLSECDMKMNQIHMDMIGFNQLPSPWSGDARENARKKEHSLVCVFPTDNGGNVELEERMDPSPMPSTVKSAELDLIHFDPDQIMEYVYQEADKKLQTFNF